MRKNHFLGRNLMVKLEEKIQKMTNFKANFRLVLVKYSVQVIPIYKARTFICKDMCNTSCKYRLNIANTSKKTLKSKHYVVLILSRTVCFC